MKLRRMNFPTVQNFEVLPKTVCNLLIELFEDNLDKTEYINEDHKPCFTQLNVNKVDSHIAKSLIPFVREAYSTYTDRVANEFLPPFKYLEEFRIKRYLPGGDERFDEHVDVTNYDTSIRSLAFLFYLNENDGHTHFPKHKLTFTPEPGHVMMFPPTWEYPHAGLPPTTTKYILSTYLHYG